MTPKQKDDIKRLVEETNSAINHDLNSHSPEWKRIINLNKALTTLTSELERVERERDEFKAKTSLEGFRSMAKQTSDAFDERDEAIYQLTLLQSAVKVKDELIQLQLKNSIEIALDRLKRFQDKGLLAGHDLSIAGLTQSLDKIKALSTNQSTPTGE